MRIIIAGSRGLSETDLELLDSAVKNSAFNITCVISGTARGADRLGEKWAQQHQIPIERYPADWKLHGRKAGFLRNEQMAKAADGLIALWDGESRGTQHMIALAKRYQLAVHVELCKTAPKKITKSTKSSSKRL